MNRKYIVTALVLALPLLEAGALLLVTQPMGYGDSATYLQTAEQPFVFVSSPHGYRILIPYVAALFSHALQIDVRTVFFALSLGAFLAINWVLLFWTIRLEELPVVTGIALSVLFSFSYAGAYNLHNFIHVGYFELLLIFIGFIAIYREKFVWLLATVFIGSWVKETVVLLLPLFAAYNLLAHRSPRFWKQFGLLCATYVGVFLFIRAGILFHGTNGLATYSNFYNLQYLELVQASWGGPLRVVKDILFTFMLLWLFAALGFVCCAGRHTRVMALMIPLAISQLLLATDVARMAMLGFPSILQLTGNVFRKITVAEQIVFTVLSVAAFYLYDHPSRFFAPFFASAFVFVLIWCIAFRLGWRERVYLRFARAQI